MYLEAYNKLRAKHCILNCAILPTGEECCFLFYNTFKHIRPKKKVYVSKFPLARYMASEDTMCRIFLYLT